MDLLLKHSASLEAVTEVRCQWQKKKSHIGFHTTDPHQAYLTFCIKQVFCILDVLHIYRLAHNSTQSVYGLQTASLRIKNDNEHVKLGLSEKIKNFSWQFLQRKIFLVLGPHIRENSEIFVLALTF